MDASDNKNDDPNLKPTAALPGMPKAGINRGESASNLDTDDDDDEEDDEGTSDSEGDVKQKEGSTRNTPKSDLSRIRKEKRLAMNRESARARRKRKKALLETLEQQVSELTNQNQRYRVTNDNLRTRVMQLEADLSTAKSTISILSASAPSATAAAALESASRPSSLVQALGARHSFGNMPPNAELANLRDGSTSSLPVGSGLVGDSNRHLLLQNHLRQQQQQQQQQEQLRQAMHARLFAQQSLSLGRQPPSALGFANLQQGSFRNDDRDLRMLNALQLSGLDSGALSSQSISALANARALALETNQRAFGLSNESLLSMRLGSANFDPRLAALDAMASPTQQLAFARSQDAAEEKGSHDESSPAKQLQRRGGQQ